MWSIGSFYKSQTVKNNCYPTFNIKLYNDTINYTASNGTSFGTKTNKYVYNDIQEKFYFETGTSVIGDAGTIKGGTLYHTRDANGSLVAGTAWTSPIICPAYNANWAGVFIQDSENNDYYDTSRIYREKFESWEHLMKEKYFLINSTIYGKGTINNTGIANETYAQGGGITGNSLYIYQGQGDPGTTFIERTAFDINRGFYGDEGEIQFIFSPEFQPAEDVTVGTFILSEFDFSDGQNINVSLVTTGSNGTLYFNYVDTAIALPGIKRNVLNTTDGTRYHVNFNWKQLPAVNKVSMRAWCNGTLVSGTHNGTHGTSDFTLWRCGAINAGSIGYDMVFDDLHIWGSAIHASTWKGNSAKAVSNADYLYRTSDNGTSFGAWQDFGTFRRYDTTDDYYRLKLGSFSGFPRDRRAQVTAPYIQFMIRFGTYNTAVNTGTFGLDDFRVIRFQPECYYSVPELDVLYISPIETRIESQNRIGLIESNGFDFKLSNTTGNYKGKDTLYSRKLGNEWESNPLLFNRPLFVNQPVRVEAGYQCSTGTEFIPAAYGYVQKTSVSADNASIAISAIDTWGIIGENIAGTRSGAGTITQFMSDIITTQGIPKEKQKIDTFRQTYTQIPMYNGKLLPLTQTNGGFGDRWNQRNVQTDDRGFAHNMGQSSDARLWVYNQWDRSKIYSADGTRQRIFWAVLSPQLTINHRFEQAYADNDYVMPPIERVFMPVAIFHGKESTVYSDRIRIYNYYEGTMRIDSYLSKSPANRNTSYVLFDGGTGRVEAMMYNSKEGANGTGYFTREKGTVGYLYSFNYLGADIQCVGTLGIFNPYGNMCMYPVPLSMAQGTNEYNYIITGQSNADQTGTGTYQFANVYAGSSPYTFRGSYYLGTLDNNPRRAMGYYNIDNVINLVGNLDYRNANQLITWGNFGGHAQHSPVIAGTVFVNGVASPSNGGTVFFNNDTGVYSYNEMFTTADNFAVSYTKANLNVSGFLGSTTAMEGIQDLTNVALYNSFFDANGNFYSKSRQLTDKVLLLDTNGKRSYGTQLIEVPISVNYEIDINKIKNRVSLKGTDNILRIYQDNTSVDTYGTRNLPEYTNTWIPTEADMNNYGTILLGYLKNAKYIVNVTIPGHPELVPGQDSFTLYDTFNNKIIDNITIKSHKFDPMNWTSTITGESYKKEEEI